MTKGQWSDHGVSLLRFLVNETDWFVPLVFFAFVALAGAIAPVIPGSH